MIFEGIDFANGVANTGRCYATDDGDSITFSFQKPDGEISITAIDCPLGTTLGFSQLLRNELPDHESNDGYKSRRTESWLRHHVNNNFQSVTRWRGRTDPERARHQREPFFNGGSHVKPTLGMLIVPDCLHFVFNQMQHDNAEQNIGEQIVNARKGEGKWIEAHPRIFLYSVTERLFCQEKVQLDDLYAAAKYKCTDDGEEHRAHLLGLLALTEWQGNNNNRIINFDPIRDELVADNHQFDAVLCALTAWAHHHHECIKWDEAGIPLNFVAEEGHILVLS